MSLREAFSLDEALRSLENVQLAKVSGRLVRVSGLLLESLGCRRMTGQRCYVEQGDGSMLEAQVVGFDRDITYLMPFKKPVGLTAGSRVFPARDEGLLHIDESWLGRVINGLGEPLDDLGKLAGRDTLSSELPVVHPLRRRPVSEPLDVGVRAINSLLTLGKGQRVGLFAGSGVGKSVLLGMITRQTKADVVVVGLIGERGREVQEFLLHSLGPEGLKKAVVVVAPANESPLMRLRAAELCHSVAAYFRDQGNDVLLLVDSLTRYAMAQREIALALGEPPATKGYPPSVFGLLPELVESAGNGDADRGSLSALYTVLAEGDDQQDPVVDCARAILDGHIVLSRRLADTGHYPAIDIAASVSRCMAQVTSAEHQQAARQLKELYSTFERIREMIPLGGYTPGMDGKTDRSVQLAPRIERFLRQDVQDAAELEQSVSALTRLVKSAP
ncbi:flagellar protein export ATPase FliI [Pseudomonas profundi]|uniref:flagellar protein export ATPase FliI n=1 Tax=Pseudomonas profundi TaxID=1981513 RepID=UPI00123C04AA|nr:flagellar protein export ATPase FliI [Pseudomonas profundi]